jgi:proteasome accessory factor C
MDKFDRIFQLHSILRRRRTALSTELLIARLECSPAALYRALNTLKNILNAPIVFDTKVGGYRYSEGKNESFELPGMRDECAISYWSGYPSRGRSEV